MSIEQIELSADILAIEEAVNHNPARHALWIALTIVVLAGLHCAVHEQTIMASFTLEGAHADIACSECHFGDYVTPPPRNCLGCHDEDTPAPHWPEECGECHGQDVWDDLEFVHEEYELTGAHLDAVCADCHEEDDWEASTICSACHEDERPEGHITLDCVDCHDTVAWEPPTWGHGFFILEGGHADRQCTDCHAGGYHDTPDECHDCHSSPGGHPDHGCEQCHNIYSWGDTNFTHDFPLTDAHANLTCIDCHAAGYEDTSSQCESCHAGTAPGGHPTTGCTDCHTPTEWSDVTFNHNFFPLEGGHDGPTCEACHQGEYGSFSASCNDCHADDSPHAFFTECAWCHDIYGW